MYLKKQTVPFSYNVAINVGISIFIGRFFSVT
jgi:hypothetical protein